MKNFLMTRNIRKCLTSSFVALMIYTVHLINAITLFLITIFSKNVFVTRWQSNNSYFSLIALTKNIQPTPKRLYEMTLTHVVVSVVKLCVQANDRSMSSFGSR